MRECVFARYSLDEFHRLGVHGEGGLGLLDAALQGIAALDEGHHRVQVVDRLLKAVQLQRERQTHTHTHDKLTSKALWS